MCGICGEFRFDGGRVNARVVVAMRESLIHRGPDEAGLYMSPDHTLGLGFRRLRIVDLTPNASQPMANEDGSVQVVFNGEIYNFQDLRRELEVSHRFRSRSDTEVIVHLYEEKGPEAIGALDGMFAIAIWDARQRRILLARDRAGKKPLFYYQDRDRLLFASEIKAFLVHPDVHLEIDSSAVPAYFAHGYVPCPRTFYRGVRQVPPATLILGDSQGRLQDRSYWTLDFPPATATAGDGALDIRTAAAHVRALTTRAVERRLVADVPIGAFLSGGIDSTIVVGIMARLTGDPVRTFSIGFEGDPAYDETPFARMAARRFGTEHTEFRLDTSALDLTEKLIWHHDGPFGDSSAVPTYVVSRMTRQHVTVVLSGDGGDEVFAGYRRFRAALLAGRLPASLRRVLAAAAATLPVPRSDKHWLWQLRRFCRSAHLPLRERASSWSGLFFGDLQELLDPDLFSSIRRADDTGAPREDDEPSPLNQLLHANFDDYLLNDLLVKADRCTMANSLEGRSPFLDLELVEYAARLPDAFKLNGGRTKVVLREAFADLLPAAIDRRPKMGFGVPLGTWFRGPLRDHLQDVLLAPDARYREYLRRPYVEQLISRHLSGRANLAHQLWSVLCFELWLRVLPGWGPLAPEAASHAERPSVQLSL